MYRKLDADRIIATVKKLNLRVNDRFAARGIADVCEELRDVAIQAKAHTARLSQPDWALRLVIAALIIFGAITFVYIGTFFKFSKINTEAIGLVQGIEAVINTSLLAGLGLAFLLNAEARLKRRKILKRYDELRSFIHVIDMHQLTKDPTQLLRAGPKTQNSPVREMSQFELNRYLDYCTEMLSICGKLAALYAEGVNDRQIISGANDIELLATNLSRKIWQKITLLERTMQEAPQISNTLPPPPPPPPASSGPASSGKA